MDLDDIFKSLLRHKGGYHGHYDHKHGDHYRDARFYEPTPRYDHHGYHHGSSMLLVLLQQVLQNKALIWGGVIVLLFLGAIGIALLFAALPLIEGLFDFVQQNGVKGVVETTAPYAEKIWNGSK